MSALHEDAVLKKLSETTDFVTMIRNLPSPRLIRSHLPYPLLPKQIKQVEPKVKLLNESNPLVLIVPFRLFISQGIPKTFAYLATITIDSFMTWTQLLKNFLNYF